MSLIPRCFLSPGLYGSYGTYKGQTISYLDRPLSRLKWIQTKISGWRRFPPLFLHIIIISRVTNSN